MATETVTRRGPMEIAQSIGALLGKSRGTVLSATLIARKTGLNYNSCKEYLGLIKYAQGLPDIEEVRTVRGRAFMLPLSAYPEAERHRIFKEEFGVRFTDADRLYIGLLEKGAVCAAKAATLEKTALVRRGLKMEHLKEARGKVYLSDLGILVAQGAKRIFNC
ncbi:MAG: hypothetical protein V1676_02620 [Candidatus Diapherotrites archaeon]